MLSPNPLSILCAVVLCLPVALLFTITGDTATTTAAISRRDDDSPPIVRVPSPTLENFTPNPTPILSYSQNPPKLEPHLADGGTKQPRSSPSPPPPDDSEDEILFREASKVNQNPSPPSSEKKVAFMFLTITPLPFAPLWELFFNQSKTKYYNIYIHADPTFSYDPPFAGVFSGRVIPSSKPTRRNTPTLISAARRLVAHALLHDPTNYMFVLLSSACVPLHSFNFTYGTLVASRKSFIEILKNETTSYGRWAARGADKMLPEVGLDDFRIGSQFWVLTRKHATVVVGDRRLWEKFKLPCVRRHTCYPEENYFPTLLSMVDPKGVVPATLTHVDWRSSHDGHPRTYNASEVGPELIERLRSGRPRYGDVGTNGSDSSVMERRDPFLFARKFAPNCLLPLLSMSNDTIFRGSIRI